MEKPTQAVVALGIAQLIHEIARKYNIPFSELDELCAKKLGLKNLRKIGKSIDKVAKMVNV